MTLFSRLRIELVAAVCKLTRAGDFAGCLRTISVGAPVLRKHPDKFDDAFFDREFEKAKTQMDPDLDDPTKILKKMEKDQERRVRAIKYARTARLFPQPQEERRLTHDTMDQIRFLNQDQPEEWTFSTLAASFDVSESVIIKVLKSKFVPKEKKKQTQDLAANIHLGLLTPGSTAENNVTASNSTKALVSGQTSSRSILDENKTPIKLQTARHFKLANKVNDINRLSELTKFKPIKKENTGSGSTQRKGSNINVKQSRHIKVKLTDDMLTKQTTQQPKQGRQLKEIKVKKNKKQVGEDKFGKLAVELDHFEDTDLPPDWIEDNECNPMNVVQRGREFYDESGELLFRV